MLDLDNSASDGVSVISVCDEVSESANPKPVAEDQR